MKRITSYKRAHTHKNELTLILYRKTSRTNRSSKPDHFFVLKKLNTRCSHDACSFCYFRILLDVNFNKMNVFVILIYNLEEKSFCKDKVPLLACKKINNQSNT